MYLKKRHECTNVFEGFWWWMGKGHETAFGGHVHYYFLGDFGGGWVKATKQPSAVTCITIFGKFVVLKIATNALMFFGILWC